MDTDSEFIEDVIERGLQRQLPVRITEAEFTEIAKKKAIAEEEIEQMELDLQREQKRRKQQIEERSVSVKRMGRELRTGEQERAVTCTRVFRRDLSGDSWVVLLRTDTGAEVSRDPAPPSLIERHLQRPLPGLESSPRSASVIDLARARQRDDEHDEHDEHDEDRDIPDPDDLPADGGPGPGANDSPTDEDGAGPSADDESGDDPLGIDTEFVDVGPQNIGELQKLWRKAGKAKGTKGRK